jgi:hypothetical protein
MVGALNPTGPRAPERGSKNSHRQEEEDAHHLQTHNAAYTAKWAQESAHAARHAFCRFSRSTSAHTGAARRSSSRLSFASPSARGHALAGHSPGNPQPDAQSTPDILRSHSVMMVSAAVAEPLFSVRLRLPVDPERQRK